jgi:outer membrane lipoprotein-sorting protein
MLILCAVPLVPNASHGASPSQSVDAQSTLERAERIRFPAKGFQVDVAINSETPGRDPDVRKYRVLSKDNDNTLVMTTAPAIDRGQILLMKESDLWLFMPEVSQPIRLPLSQRLTGQVANGDLARAKFIGDYNASYIQTETIDGEDYFLLELQAAHRRVTYRRILYWVHSTTFRPLKAEFYSVSKRLLKSCYYRSYQMVLGETRPTQLLIIDALRKGHESVLDYSDMKLRELPDKVFTKQYLKKLQ